MYRRNSRHREKHSPLELDLGDSGEGTLLGSKFKDRKANANDSHKTKASKYGQSKSRNSFVKKLEKVTDGYRAKALHRPLKRQDTPPSELPFVGIRELPPRELPLPELSFPELPTYEYVYSKETGGLIRKPEEPKSESIASTLVQSDNLKYAELEGPGPSSTRTETPVHAPDAFSTTASKDIIRTEPKTVGLGDLQAELSQLPMSFRQSRQKNPELRGSGEEATKDVTSQLFMNYDRISLPIRDRNGNIDPTAYNRALSGVKDELRVAIARIRSQEDRIKDQHHHVGTLKSHLAALKSQLEEATKSHSTALREEERAFQDDKERLKLAYEHLLIDLRKDLDRISEDANNRQSEDRRKIEILETHLANVEASRDQDHNAPTRKDLAEAKDALRAARTQIQEQSSAHRREAENLNQQIADLRFQLKECELSHNNTLRTERRALQSENEKLRSMYESQLRKSRDDANSARKQAGEARTATERLQAQLATAKVLHDEAYASWKADNVGLEERLRATKADNAQRMQDMEGKAERKLQRERKKYEDLVKSLQIKIASLNQAMETERSRKAEELQSQRKELEDRDREERYGLRAEIEMFKLAISRRDHFEGLTDREIVSRYKRLATSIEDFVRIEWDRSIEEQWPVSEEVMRQLGRNPRKMKCQIIQNTLWIMLFDHIFGSPFRVLGTAGEEYDEDWASFYSEGASSYNWPEFSPETERGMERSRCENAKACMDATGSSSATGSELRESFERSVVAIMSAIVRVLNTVASVQDKHRGGLEAIIRLAAKIWLESCSQKYRMVVVLPRPDRDILSNPTTFDGTLKLVLRPELKRYGDNQGRHLTRGEQVAGWQGLLETYP